MSTDTHTHTHTCTHTHTHTHTRTHTHYSHQSPYNQLETQNSHHLSPRGERDGGKVYVIKIIQLLYRKLTSQEFFIIKNSQHPLHSYIQCLH